MSIYVSVLIKNILSTFLVLPVCEQSLQEDLAAQQLTN